MPQVYSTFLTLLLLLPLTSVAADESPFPTEFPWGRLQPTEAAVELHLTSIPDDRRLRIPRFNNPYRKIRLKGDDSKASLKFRPEVSEWLITIPEAVTAPATIVIETVGRPQLLSTPAVIRADKDGVFKLPAHHAVVHGELLRYEPQPHKNTVGYWANEQDWCEWQLNAERPGDYDVHILQGCGKDHGGSEVRISAGESEITFTVEDTGHFQNFKDRHVGTIRLREPGRQSLQVRALSKTKGAVMDVRQIRLLPSGTADEAD